MPRRPKPRHLRRVAEHDEPRPVAALGSGRDGPSGASCPGRPNGRTGIAPGRAVPPESAARGPRRLVVATAALGLALAACHGRGGLRVPHRLGHGAVETCPPVRIAAEPGQPHPDRVRCSYSDLAGDELVRLRGVVLAEQRDAPLGEPLAGMRVSVHPFGERDDPRRPRTALAEGASDPHGDFLLEAELERGDYLLVARAQDSDEVLAYSRFTLRDDPPGDQAQLRLIVPRGPALASPRAEEDPASPLPDAPPRPAWAQTPRAAAPSSPTPAPAPAPAPEG